MTMRPSRSVEVVKSAVSESVKALEAPASTRYWLPVAKPDRSSVAVDVLVETVAMPDHSPDPGGVLWRT